MRIEEVTAVDEKVMRARQARRRSIMAAAAGLFAACGYRAASMEEIACRAGISKPVLYKSFSSKLELYLAVLHEEVQGLEQTLTVALGHAGDLESIVTATVAAVFDFADTHPRGAALLADAAVAEEPSAQRLAHRAATICNDAVSQALAAYPFARAEQRRLIAVELVAIAQACARDWAIHRKPIPKRDAVSTTAGLCWNGLAGVRTVAQSPAGSGDPVPVLDTAVPGQAGFR
ncbi:TetR/AcrR family transcriptional regulator [Nocardia tengchongensis]|uniref:TetR/AcrR family transcriptional regulator n=1 Tax=Nocardia tengchongensis TaxID=2055889 RepID=A0ABX8CHK4_9NOCA|nr:TetR/AcrR family transcriptional regulator [Nocardia tengchongensis]QVI18897.1 TetR/AcrR family transcriptional regulator [Nocardia tengchongensis]